MNLNLGEASGPNIRLICNSIESFALDSEGSWSPEFGNDDELTDFSNFASHCVKRGHKPLKSNFVESRVAGLPMISFSVAVTDSERVTDSGSGERGGSFNFESEKP